MTRNELIIECRRRSKAGEDVESIMGYLRAAGCSKIDSIAVLNGACGIGLAEAKVFVHLSVTWADRRASETTKDIAFGWHRPRISRSLSSGAHSRDPLAHPLSSAHYPESAHFCRQIQCDGNGPPPLN